MNYILNSISEDINSKSFSFLVCVLDNYHIIYIRTDAFCQRTREDNFNIQRFFISKDINLYFLLELFWTELFWTELFISLCIFANFFLNLTKNYFSKYISELKSTSCFLKNAKRSSELLSREREKVKNDLALRDRIAKHRINVIEFKKIYEYLEFYFWSFGESVLDFYSKVFRLSKRKRQNLKKLIKRICLIFKRFFRDVIKQLDSKQTLINCRDQIRWFEHTNGHYQFCEWFLWIVRRTHFDYYS